MDPEEQITKPDLELEEPEIDSFESVDDFIKELEAKERDLHITADLTFEIAQLDFDVDEVPTFIADEIKAPITKESSAPKKDEKKTSRTGNKTRVYELEQEIGKLKDRVAELQAERKEIQENSDRRLKDFQNFKYRVDRERRGSFIEQIANLAAQMLPVLDNLDRAIEASEKTQSKRSPAFQQFYEGIILVNQQVNEIFSDMGVTPIASVGEPFDPAFHEAVAMEARNDLPPNTISEEMLRGFRIGNRVIRHSMVKVATSPQAAKEVVAGEVVAKIVEDKDVDLFDESDKFEFPDEAPVPDDTSALEDK